MAQAAVVETENGGYCWVATAQGPQQRPLELGDSNDVFTVVIAGLKEGDEVFLNPLAISPAPKNSKQSNQESPEPKAGK